MRQRALRRDAERISLFPFLAVLICTMGALLVLLVVIAQRAQARARAEHAAQTVEVARSHVNDVEELAHLESQIGRLRARRDAAGNQLADQREALSHVEDHMRRLNDQLRSLQETAKQLQQNDAGDSQRLEAIRAEIQRVENQIAESEKLLAEALADASQRPVAYSVVPYEGPNGTFRRPIYIECQANAVTLQPEGIQLTEQDFTRPLGPDNPLAAVLRTASEHLATGGAPGTRPYPLLLVRPSGISAYYAARGAMKSWGSEFGYELIGEDWNLEFPAADPRMAQLVQDALTLARQRHRLYQEKQAPAGRNRTRLRKRPGPGTASADASTSTGRADLRFGQDAAKPAAPQTVNAPSPAGSAPSPDGSAPSPDGTSKLSANSPNRPGRPTPGLQSIAKTRGKDWALPRASKGSVPFTRPIRIECSADRLVIVPRDSRANWHVIAADGPTAEVVEKFVAAVWEHMQSWGIAGRGMYWKPALYVRPSPGGEVRAADLKVLLERSGLDVVVEP